MVEAWKSVFKTVQRVEHVFAVPVLLKTLFSPWKQIVTLPGRSLDEKLRAAVDNLVSRIVGFFARLGALILATISMTAAFALMLVVAFAWPFIPFFIIYLLIRGIIG